MFSLPSSLSLLKLPSVNELVLLMRQSLEIAETDLSHLNEPYM